jgi:peptidoglycan lytic transglycosylase B
VALAAGILLGAAGLAAARTDRAPARSAQGRCGHFDLHRPEIARFVREVSRRDALSRRHVLWLLGRAHPKPRIIDLMGSAPERSLEWYEYRDRLVSARRIDAGVRFWLEHRAILERTAHERGVPARYIVAILGCETFYGRDTGRDRVLDALATLAFDYPPRARYFQGELEQFLLLVREDHLDPLAVRGSYSGAMGAPQFMPSVYRRYAVNERHDRRLDLWKNWADVFASVANYLRRSGWETGAPVLVRARVEPGTTLHLDAHGLDVATLGALSTQGVRVDPSEADALGVLPDSTPAVLVSAEQASGPAYRVGFNNFRVLMRYNRSADYAMAVHDLAESIAERVRQARAAAGA